MKFPSETTKRKKLSEDEYISIGIALTRIDFLKAHNFLSIIYRNDLEMLKKIELSYDSTYSLVHALREKIIQDGYQKTEEDNFPF